MPRSLLSFLLCGAFVVALPACSSTDDTPYVPPGPFPVMQGHLDGFDSIFAVGEVFLGGQPNPLGLANARDAGVTLVINSRPSSEMTFDEGAVARSLGMKYVSLPFVPSTLEPAQVEAFIRLINDGSREGKVLVHCSSGNRVAALWAMYEISQLDMPPEEAVARARKMGLRSPELIVHIGDYARSVGAMADG